MEISIEDTKVINKPLAEKEFGPLIQTEFDALWDLREALSPWKSRRIWGYAEWSYVKKRIIWYDPTILTTPTKRRRKLLLA
jgi:hypothetical protein